MKLNFRQAGEGKPLIILHGLFGSGDNWVTVTKPLAEHYHVYVLDQRNHGRSPHSPVHSYLSMADDLLEFISDNKIENPYILGHSMGGKTAMQLALNHSDKLEKLVVVDISPRYYKPHHQDVISGLSAVDLENIKSREEAETAMLPYLAELGVRQFLLKNLYRSESGGFAWRMNLDAIVGQIENIGMENKGVPFTKPTLFLRGENSNYIQEKDHEIIKNLFPNSNIQTIAGAGHWVQAEKPREFVEAVVTFLNS
ncbi:MAG: alpha/beta fold hydrolase [Opitutaceae bacterium]|nr:alpha/beta fold hydrolase [Cytophagales bacterium]